MNQSNYFSTENAAKILAHCMDGVPPSAPSDLQEYVGGHEIVEQSRPQNLPVGTDPVEADCGVLHKVLQFLLAATQRVFSLRAGAAPR